MKVFVSFVFGSTIFVSISSMRSWSIYSRILTGMCSMDGMIGCCETAKSDDADAVDFVLDIGETKISGKWRRRKW